MADVNNTATQQDTNTQAQGGNSAGNTQTQTAGVDYDKIQAMIDKGTTQREIARKFGMSLCKITRGSRELKKQNSAFRRFLELAKKL